MNLSDRLYHACLGIDFGHSFQVELHPDTVRELIKETKYLQSNYIPDCMWTNFEKVKRPVLSWCGVSVFLNSEVPGGEFRFLQGMVHTSYLGLRNTKNIR